MPKVIEMMTRNKSTVGEKETVKVDWSNAQIATIHADPLLEIGTNDKEIIKRVNELCKRHGLKTQADLLRYLVDNCFEVDEVMSRRPGRKTTIIELDSKPETVEIEEDINPKEFQEYKKFYELMHTKPKGSSCRVPA